MTARTLNELMEMTKYQATSPDSPFTGDLFVTPSTENGLITLTGEILTITEHREYQKKHFPSEQLDSLLYINSGRV